MSFKEKVVDLVLQAKNLLSKPTDQAATSVDGLADSAAGLRDNLHALEDQKTLINQFKASEKAVDRTGSAYDRLRLRSEKMADKLESSTKVTKAQQREWYALQESLGKAEAEAKKAEKTFDKLGGELRDAGVDITDLSEAQKKNQKATVAAKRAQQDFNKKVDEGGSRVDRFRKGLSRGILTFVKWGAAAAAASAAVAATALTRFTSQQADMARQTLATSDAFGISTDALQKWQYAAESVGIEGDKVSDIMKDVAEKIGDAFANGGGEAVEVLEKLNLDVREMVKLRPDEQILKIATQLKGLPKPQQIVILESLASDASILLPLLDDNAAKLKELAKAAEERGVIVSPEDLARLAETNKAFKRIGDRLTEFKNKLASQLAPTFKAIAEDFDEFLKNTPGLVDNIVEGFSELVESAKGWVKSILDNREEISATFTTIGNTVDGVRLTFVALFRGVQSFGAGALEVAARVAYSWNEAGLAILELRNKIGLATDEAVEKARAGLGVLGQSVLDLKKQSEDYQAQMIQAGKDAAISFDNAASGAKQAGGAVGALASETERLANEQEKANETSTAAAESTRALSDDHAALGRHIAETVKALEAANKAWSEDPSDTNLQRVEELRIKYHDLQSALSKLSIPPVEGVDALKDDLAGVSDAAESAAESVGRVYSQVVTLGEGAASAGDKVDEVGDAATSSAEAAGSAVGTIFNGWSRKISSLSSQASAAFRRALGGGAAGGSADDLASRLENVNSQLHQMRANVSGNQVGLYMRKIARTGLDIERSFLNQAISVEKLTEQIRNGDNVAYSLNRTVADVERQFSLLDGRQLQPLISAIQSARRESEGLNQSLLDTIASAEQELAALRGNSAEVERLRYLERQGELQGQLTKAQALGDQETIANARKALSLAESAYSLRTRQAKERDAQEKKDALGRESSRQVDRQTSEREERQTITRTEQRTQSQTSQLSRAISNRVVTIDFRINGEALSSVDAFSESQVEQLVRAIQTSRFLTTG